MIFKEKKHPVGTQRRMVRFAWLPVRLDDGDTVWLERYVEVIEYAELGHIYYPYAWKVVSLSKFEKQP